MALRFAALAVAALVMATPAMALFGGSDSTAASSEAEEGAPIAREISISTYRGIPYRAQFLATDSEGDDMTFAVADAPRKGTVTIDGADFVYTPDEGVTGSDSFTYTATDSAGHVSQPATVTLL